MNQRKIVSLLSSLLLLSGLASCGETTPTTTPTTTAAGDTTATENTTVTNSDAPEGTVVIDFWHCSGQAIIDSFTKYINKFQKLVKEKEGVDVQIRLAYQGGYPDILNKITKGFATNNYPTLAIAYPDHVADYLAVEKNPGDFVVDLTSYANDSKIGFGKEDWIGDEGADDFVEAFYDEGRHYTRSGLYSLPLMKSSEIMFYNIDLCKRIVPDYLDDVSYSGETKLQKYMNSLTWDQFIDLCKFIRENYAGTNNPAGYPTAIDYPAQYDSDSNLFISKCYQNNYQFLDIDQDGNGEILFNNDQAKKMVEKLKVAHDNKYITTKGVTGEYGSNFFKEQKMVFTIGSSGGSEYQAPSGGAFKVGVCKVPFDNNNPLYVTQGLSTTILRHKGEGDDLKVKYAFKFLKYLTSAEVSSDICVNGSGGYIPVRKSAYETDLYQTYLEGDEDDSESDFLNKSADIVINEIDGHYLNTPCFPGTAKVRTEVGGIISQVLLGKKDIDTAFADAENNSRLNS